MILMIQLFTVAEAEGLPFSIDDASRPEADFQRVSVLHLGEYEI